MSKSINWGFIGTGYAANKFAEGLRFLPDAQLLAVSSRTLSNAQEFARQFNIPHTYKSYEDLVKNKDIDVVYVATPHIRHKDDCILCLEAGKAVLCEKPFTLNASQAREVIALAHQKQLFCMEAMWTRFIPIIQKVQHLINSGVIGEMRILTADFGMPTEFNQNNRFFNPELGGGSLLDRGVYPLSLAFQLLGSPSSIVSQPSMGDTGVDEQSAIILGYPQGQLAILYASLRTRTTNEVIIIGTQGQIRIHAPIYSPSKLSITKFPGSTSATNSLTLKRRLLKSTKKIPLLRRLYFRFNNESINIKQPFQGNGYNYEAAEVMSCLRNGELESKIMPLEQTLSIMETMDTIRQQWKFKYPGE